MRKNRAIALVAALALFGMHAAQASEYIDLEARFGDVESYEYNDVTYYKKDRVSTTLVMCANFSEEGVGSAEMIVLLPIDDDAKTVAPIEIQANTIASWLEDAQQDETLMEIFAQSESAEDACVKMMDALNGLFPSAMIEHYMTLDLRGLPLLDGIENTEENVTGDALMARLRNIKSQVESGAMSANSMLNSLSGYIVTDMKSGAMMKVVDKVDRYERSHRMPFPVLTDEIAQADENDENAQEAQEQTLEPDLDAFEQMMIDIYYQDTKIW